MNAVDKGHFLFREHGGDSRICRQHKLFYQLVRVVSHGGADIGYFAFFVHVYFRFDKIKLHRTVVQALFLQNFI